MSWLLMSPAIYHLIIPLGTRDFLIITIFQMNILIFEYNPATMTII